VAQAAKVPPIECPVPVCRSSRVARILYGLPMFTPELNRDLEEGRTVLAGCCVFGDDPEWVCLTCGHRWGRIEWPDSSEQDDSES
jgi:hypothetical protein